MRANTVWQLYGTGLCNYSANMAKRWIQQKIVPHTTRPIICIAGGRGRHALPSLRQRRADTIIHEHVQRGAIYIGICCGAYLATRTVTFGDDIVNERGLSLVPSLDSFGPVASPNDSYRYNCTSEMRYIDIHAARGTTGTPRKYSDCFYQGGGTFSFSSVPPETVEVHATYSTQEPCVVTCRDGLGMYILTGIHPELSSDSNCHTMFQTIVRSCSQTATAKIQPGLLNTTESTTPKSGRRVAAEWLQGA